MTYRIDEELLRDKIDSIQLVEDKAVNDELRGIIKACLFDGMIGYTKGVMASIEQKVLSQLDGGDYARLFSEAGKDSGADIPEIIRKVEKQIKLDSAQYIIGDIVTALVIAPEEEYEGLVDMRAICSPDDEDTIFFVDDSYETTRSVKGDASSGKTYKGAFIVDGDRRYFEYTIEHSREYLIAQEKLFRLADIYRMLCPVIWSPFSTKAFVPHPTEPLPDGAQIDWLFKENDIPAIEGGRLMWNLAPVAVRPTAGRPMQPYGNGVVKYRYTFEKSRAGNLVLAVPTNDRTHVYGCRYTNDGIDIWTDGDMDDFWAVEYRSINTDSRNIKKLMEDGRYFTNSIERSSMPHRRIVSNADIEYAIFPFRERNGITCSIADGLGTVCARYASKYRADITMPLRYKQTEPIYLKFSSKGDRFLDDYINFVLQYLEHFYPEITWAGGW